MTTRPGTSVVQLFEDSAGHLFLRLNEERMVWADVEQLRDDDADLLGMAEALFAGDTQAWTLPQTPYAGLTSDTRIVATIGEDATAPDRIHTWPCGHAASYLLARLPR